MIVVDSALERREKEGNPIRVAMIGCGMMGRGIALQILQGMPGIRLVAIYNRTIAEAERAYREAGAANVQIAESVEEVEESILRQQYVVTDNPFLLCQAEGVEAILEVTGTIEFAADVVLKAIEHRKHVVTMNAELQGTLGPILKQYADRAGVVFTDADGDQPGVIMNLYRFVKSVGYTPVLAGNIKGMLDHYRNPETQQTFSQKYLVSPQMATNFADGTKLAFEMSLVANATGMKVGQRGMYGPQCDDVHEAAHLFPLDQLLKGGAVDYILGAEPGPGVFVLGYSDHPVKQHYMKYLKMGDGPLYVFYRPYHLCHVEVPLTVARAILFHDAAVAPLGGPICDVITLAKRDLTTGEMLDGIGGFACYGVLENSDVCQSENLLPMGLSQGCRLKRDIPRDTALTYDDVEIPDGRLCDKLRDEQNGYFLPSDQK